MARFQEGDQAIVARSGEKVTVLSFNRLDWGVCVYKCINNVTENSFEINSIDLRPARESCARQADAIQLSQADAVADDAQHRFVSLSKDELDEISAKAFSSSTKSTTKWRVRIVKGKLNN